METNSENPIATFAIIDKFFYELKPSVDRWLSSHDVDVINISFTYADERHYAIISYKEIKDTEKINIKIEE